jgi:hypothetical protein
VTEVAKPPVLPVRGVKVERKKWSTRKKVIVWSVVVVVGLPLPGALANMNRQATAQAEGRERATRIARAVAHPTGLKAELTRGGFTYAKTRNPARTQVALKHGRDGVTWYVKAARRVDTPAHAQDYAERLGWDVSWQRQVEDSFLKGCEFKSGKQATVLLTGQYAYGPWVVTTLKGVDQ